MSTFSAFVTFLKDYNRYKVENFSVKINYDDLFNSISHFVETQNFIFYICLRYVDIFGFCQFSRRL